MITLHHTRRETEYKLMLTNLYVEKNGKRVSTIAKTLIIKGEFGYRSDEGEVLSEVITQGDFVFLNRKSTLSYYDSLCLCFYEEKDEPMRPYSGWDGTEGFWPLISLCDSISTPLLVCEGAVYIPSNPVRANVWFTNPHIFHKELWKDTHASGRWIFPHSEGSLAAYQHMRETTLSDDYQRLLPFLSDNPQARATFADL